MNEDRIKGQWKQLAGKLKEKWGKLTDNDLQRADGSSEVSRASGLAGADSAVPTGVPVRIRSPGSRRWNRESACNARSGG